MEINLLDLFVDTDNEILDGLNLVLPIVADVGHAVHMEDQIGNIGDGRDRVLGSLRNIRVMRDVDHGELAPVDNVRELLELLDEVVTITALVRVEEDKGHPLGVVGKTEELPLLRLPDRKIVASQK